MINVTDFEEAKRFYCGVLGFKLKAEFEPALVFEHDGPDFIAHKCEKVAEIDYPNVAQSLFIFEVDDIESEVTRLRKEGVEFIQDQLIQASVGKYIGFRDPFGNVHELIES